MEETKEEIPCPACGTTLDEMDEDTKMAGCSNCGSYVDPLWCKELYAFQKEMKVWCKELCAFQKEMKERRNA